MKEAIETSNMGSNHPLSKAATIGEVTGWQLHWLTCKLDNLRNTLERDFAGITEVGSVLFSEAAAEFNAFRSDYQRIVWEVKTILGLDYESSVYPMLHSLPKHAEYLAAEASLKTTLARIADRAGSNLRDSLLAQMA